MGKDSLRLVRRFFRNKLAVFSTLILLFYLCAALFAPWIAPYDPTEGNLSIRRQPPSKDYWLGTDQQGRDMLSRLIWGSRTSLMVAFVSVGIGLSIGAGLGLISGYSGGLTDTLIMRVMDVFISFPYILLVIAVINIFGHSMFNAMLAIGFSTVPYFARLIRSVIVGLREKEYVTAAVALGASHLRIILKYLLPNCIGVIFVQTIFFLARAIMIEASISFLGMGVQPPTPSWGVMISTGRVYLRVSPHLSIAPGIAIMILVMALNIFGDRLRDVADPMAAKI